MTDPWPGTTSTAPSSPPPASDGHADRKAQERQEPARWPSSARPGVTGVVRCWLRARTRRCSPGAPRRRPPPWAVRSLSLLPVAAPGPALWSVVVVDDSAVVVVVVGGTVVVVVASESAHSAGPWWERSWWSSSSSAGRSWSWCRRDRGRGRGGRRRGRRVVLVVRVASVPTGRGWRDGHCRTGAGVLEVSDVRDELRQVLVLRGLVRRQGDRGLRRALAAASRRCSATLRTPSAVPASGKQIAGRHAEVLLRHDAIRVLRRTRRERLRPSAAHEGAPEYNPLLTYSLTANFCRVREAAPNWLGRWPRWNPRRRARDRGSQPRSDQPRPSRSTAGRPAGPMSRCRRRRAPTRRAATRAGSAPLNTSLT